MKSEVAGQQQPQAQPSPPRKTSGNNNAAPGSAQPSSNPDDLKIIKEADETPAGNEKEKMTTEPLPPFYAALAQALARRQAKLEAVCAKDDPVSRRVLEDYGAMFLASEQVVPPPVCMFKSEAEVQTFQNAAKFKSVVVGGARIDLQPAAMDELLAAKAEAQKLGLDITPRGGSEAARRSYSDTVRLWNTRFLPALAYWNQRGRLATEEVARLRRMPLYEQVSAVLDLEKKGIYFSKDLSKSILYSIAAPGTSQHIAMLALDVAQFGDARVRRILARHGWFQTVKSDLPHFTFLGVEETDLPALGLRRVTVGAQLFWIPDTGE